MRYIMSHSLCAIGLSKTAVLKQLRKKNSRKSNQPSLTLGFVAVWRNERWSYLLTGSAIMKSEACAEELPCRTVHIANCQPV